MHVELQLHVGNVEEVLHVVVAVLLWTDVKVTGEWGHCDDIINVLGMREPFNCACVRGRIDCC